VELKITDGKIEKSLIIVGLTHGTKERLSLGFFFIGFSIKRDELFISFFVLTRRLKKTYLRCNRSISFNSHSTSWYSNCSVSSWLGSSIMYWVSL